MWWVVMLLASMARGGCTQVPGGIVVRDEISCRSGVLNISVGVAMRGPEAASSW
jgi:hypothetical protein